MIGFYFKLSVVVLVCTSRNIQFSLAEGPTYDEISKLQDFFLKDNSYPMQALAESWTSKCLKREPDPIKDLRNYQTHATIAISTEQKRPSIPTMAAKWADEKRFYNYANNSCSGICTNYKKIVWGYNTDFGCAINKCDASKSQDKKAFYIMACVYNTLQTPSNGVPYVAGPSCKCPQGYTCHRKQCLKSIGSK